MFTFILRPILFLFQLQYIVLAAYPVLFILHAFNELLTTFDVYNIFIICIYILFLFIMYKIYFFLRKIRIFI